MDTKIQNYIKLVYSDKSELNTIPDLEERKKAACAKAKLDFDSNQDIVRMKNKDVNEAIFDFLRKQNANEYILLICDQHLFWEIMQRQMEPLEDCADKDTVMKDLELKTKISKEAQSLLGRIKERYISIFVGDKEVEVAAANIRLKKLEDRIIKKSM